VQIGDLVQIKFEFRGTPARHMGEGPHDIGLITAIYGDYLTTRRTVSILWCDGDTSYERLDVLQVL
jgi:hypothetical protein